MEKIRSICIVEAYAKDASLQAFQSLLLLAKIVVKVERKIIKRHPILKIVLSGISIRNTKHYRIGANSRDTH